MVGISDYHYGPPFVRNARPGSHWVGEADPKQFWINPEGGVVHTINALPENHQPPAAASPPAKAYPRSTLLQTFGI